MKNLIHTAVVALFAAALLNNPVDAADLLVPSQYASIQAAVDAASDGDSVIVSDGNSWSGFAINGKSIVVRSVNGFSVTKVVGSVTANPGIGGTAEVQDIMLMGGVTVESGLLRSNGARHANSAVTVSASAAFFGSNAEFINATLAVSGGFGEACSINGCSFRGCATAISYARPLLAITNCSFDTCPRSIDAANSNVVVTASTFVNCIYTGQRGTCVIGSGSFDRCAFTNCQAVKPGIYSGITSSSASGGAIFASGSITCSQCDFQSCTVYVTQYPDYNGNRVYAEASGGAIRAGAGSAVRNCSFNGCGAIAEVSQAPGINSYLKGDPTCFGGSIALVGPSSVENSVISNSSAVVRYRNVVNTHPGWNNGVGDCRGGAIFLSAGSIDRCTIEGSSATSEQIGWGSFQAAEYGGGCCGSATGTMSIRDSSLHNNFSRWGNAVAGPLLELTRCQVASNGTPGSGPACLVIAGGSPVSEGNFYQSFFSANTGAPSSIGTEGANSFAYLDACVFCGTEASECGGSWFKVSTNRFGVTCGIDCDNDGTDDAFEIALNPNRDANHDGIPDVCQQPTCRDADLFRDGQINGADLGALLSQWGPANANTVSDINHDGVVNGADLGFLLFNWGPCQ